MRKLYLQNKRGFTLIELLVVIAIISLMSSIVFASLNSARAKGRDAKRKQDIHQIQLALEFYYDKYGGYPSSACPSVNYAIPPSLAMEPKLTQFLSKFPVDPLYTVSTAYNEQYLYLSDAYNVCGGQNSAGSTYALYGTLEDQSKTNLNATNPRDNWLMGGAGANLANSNRPNWRVGEY